MPIRRALYFLAAPAAAAALLVVLHQQFTHDRAAWPGLALSGALLVWWFVRLRPARRTAALAWAARGLLLVAAAAYYATAGLDRPRLDPVLATLAVALIVAGVFQRAAPAFPRGRRLVVSIAYLVAALAARYLGHWLALALFWVPAAATDRLVLPLAIPVWLLWAVVIGFGLGFLQRYEIRQRRVTQAQGYTTSYGYHSHTNTAEHYQDQELIRPPIATGLLPLVRLRWMTGSWTSSTSSYGYGSGDTTSTTHADGRWLVRAFHFPPAYLPMWLDPLVRAARRRSGREVGVDGGEGPLDGSP